MSRKNSLRINAFLNVARQSFSVLLPLITFPYVSRILGSIQYGRYSFSSSVVTYFSLIGSYGISNYAVREGARIRNSREKISHLASDLFTFNLISIFVSFFLLTVAIILSTKLKDYSSLILVQSTCMIFSMIGIDWINTVYEDFLYITLRYIFLQMLATILIFILVKTPRDTLIYSAILVGASYGGNLINLIYIRKYVDIRISKISEIKKYILPLTAFFVNSLAVIIYVNSDVTMIGYFRTDAEVGVYAFSSKIYNVLKYTINSAIVVAVPRLANFLEKDVNIYYSYLYKIFEILPIILFPASTFLFVFADSIIYVAGGAEYISSFISFRILILSLVFALFASVFTNCILIINRLERYCLISTIISAMINIILNLVLIQHFGIVGAAITTTIAEISNFIIQFYVVNKKTKVHPKIDSVNICAAFMGCIIVLIFCIPVNIFVDVSTVYGSLLKIIGGAIISVLFYALYLVITKNKLINLILF